MRSLVRTSRAFPPVGALRVAFQPIFEVRAQTRRLHGLEALVRGPRGTPFESATRLFEHVRRTAQEGPIDRACVAAIFGAVGAVSGQPDVSVNVHASTLGCDPDIVFFLEELSARHAVSLSRLTLEIVEHASPCDARLLARNLDRLRDRGARIALDDFGVGHSNHRMLLDCRPDVLKIDRYLVGGCHADPLRQAVVESVAHLAPRLGARVVAEGVETEDDLRTVAALGIELVQGFLLSRPFYPRADGAGWPALSPAGHPAPDPIRGWPPPVTVLP